MGSPRYLPQSLTLDGRKPNQNWVTTTHCCSSIHAVLFTAELTLHPLLPLSCTFGRLKLHKPMNSFLLHCFFFFCSKIKHHCWGFLYRSDMEKMLIVSTSVFQEWLICYFCWGIQCMDFQVDLKKNILWIRNYCSYGRQYVMTISDTRKIGDLILHILKEAQPQHSWSIKYLGLALGSITSLSCFWRENPWAFTKLRTW